MNDLNQVERANHLWQEWAYRHTMFWSAFTRWGVVMLAVDFAPFFNKDIPNLGGWWWMIYPFAGILVCVFGAFHLFAESARMRMVGEKLNAERKPLELLPPRLPDEAKWDRLLKSRLDTVMVMAFLLGGIALAFAACAFLVTKNHAGSVAISGVSHEGGLAVQVPITTDWWTLVGGVVNCATFVILGIGTYFVARQIKFGTWIKAQDIFMDQKFTDARSKVFGQLIEDHVPIENFEKLIQQEPHKEHGMLMCRQLDGFARLIGRWGLSEKEACNVWGNPLMKAGKLLHPLIKEEQKQCKWDSKWAAFEKLARKAWESAGSPPEWNPD